MDQKVITSSLTEYIKHIAKNSELNIVLIEKVINTQIAILFGDLAVKGEADFFLGNIKFQEDKIEYNPNTFISDLILGKIDPAFLLKEILENV